jgi:S-adenosylmethionine-diacylglycerol 3-amino-3-carboxypropyl transferase
VKRVSRSASGLNYSSVNEDWRTEATALACSAGSNVLCMTGSGARPLDLLALGPARVVAVDANPAQNALLILKAAAMGQLPFEKYVRFLGLAPARSGERLAVLASLSPYLPPDVADFWNTQRRAVATGVLWAGRWERYFRVTARAARLLRPRATARLFSFDDIAAQRRFVARSWDSALGRLLTRLVLSRTAARFLLRDPAFATARNLDAGRFVHERMTAHLAGVLAKESFMVSLVLRGRLPAKDLPPHLTPSGVEAIRPRLDRLVVLTTDVVDLLEDAARVERFDAFSLSDIPSYLTQERFERLLDGLVRRAAPGARFCIRLFLVRPSFPERFTARLVRDPSLERCLAREDHAFAYDFIAGRVAA